MSTRHQANDPTGVQVQAPLHRQIAESLTRQVSSGKLKPGERLPSERQIARQFRASRATVRTALGHLEQAGLIARRERRSAIVSIRRDVSPYMRIACAQPRLANLLGRLAEMQMLPPRCQVHLIDLGQDGAVSRLLAQPLSGADVVLCDLEYVGLFRGRADVCAPVSRRLLADIELFEPARRMCTQEDDLLAVPLGIWPHVVYGNRELLGGIDGPGEVSWTWNRLVEVARQASRSGRYGFQFRPVFSHVAAIMGGRGGQLYQSDGQVAATTSPVFEPTVRFIHELVHGHRVAPILSKADPLNLFADLRCAMALDGYQNYARYRERLGERLEVMSLPEGVPGWGTLAGYAAIVLAGAERETQLLQDLLRTLASANTQRVLAQHAGGLPIRVDLLNQETLEQFGMAADHAGVFLKDLQRVQPVNLPRSGKHKRDVEQLFLELWLGLDNIESICRRFKEV